MAKRIAIIQGHPDQSKQRYCRAIAAAYEKGAIAAGHTVETIDVAALTFPFLRTKKEYEQDAPKGVRKAQDVMKRADHLVIIFPLWLGDMPALLKAFLEQSFRPGFAYGGMDGRFPKPLLKGKSARIFVTMGMPAPIYRLYFRAHGLKNLRRNILGFCGIAPIRDTLIGMVEAKASKARVTWLSRAEALGRKGE